MKLSIRKLSDRTLPDFLAYFDHVAFADNPEWAWCYCFHHHADDDQAEQSGPRTERLCVGS